MVTIPWWFVRYGFPVVVLALVTGIVLVGRPALHGDDSVRSAPAKSVIETTPTTPRTKSARVTAYSVRSGDTLAGIADRFGTTVDRLMELNPGIDPQALRVGQPIRID
jgi:LysM repeat protein